MDVEHPTKLTERRLHVPLERERCEIPAHGTLAQIEAEIEGDSVELHLADASAPTLIREGDKAQALYVLMPMRV